MLEAIDGLVQTFDHAVYDRISVPALIQFLREKCKSLEDVDEVTWNALLDVLQLWDSSEDMSAQCIAVAKNRGRDLFLSTCGVMEYIIKDFIDACDDSEYDPWD
jgi:hypothetical protein